jgi:hypothetical protein
MVVAIMRHNSTRVPRIGRTTLLRPKQIWCQRATTGTLPLAASIEFHSLDARISPDRVGHREMKIRRSIVQILFFRPQRSESHKWASEYARKMLRARFSGNRKRWPGVVPRQPKLSRKS